MSTSQDKIEQLYKTTESTLNVLEELVNSINIKDIMTSSANPALSYAISRFL